MKLVIGLGNPPGKYELNRHNAGHLFIDRISKIKAQKPPSDEPGRITGEKGVFLKTDCLMNDSGRFVAEKMGFYHLQPEDLYIVHDDLDLRLGVYKIQLGVGPKVHYGVNSIEEALGTKDFWRVRIGTDNRLVGTGQGPRAPGESYVLENFSREELRVLESVFEKIHVSIAN